MHLIEETDTGYDITLTRGDSLYLEIGITREDGQPYVPQPGDSIRFAMKKSYDDPDEQAILVKQIPIETLLLSIRPADTKSLPMKSKYVYDIQLTTGSQDVDTFIEGKFKVDKEVM